MCSVKETCADDLFIVMEAAVYDLCMNVRISVCPPRFFMKSKQILTMQNQSVLKTMFCRLRKEICIYVLCVFSLSVMAQIIFET
ncbi:hypothetical protein Ae201684P_013853 [Aphanomyces euteiches]|uniref:Uncharacterized protein n=1 Tax=Aphanomyces euteiches TaxID=100861 RepID=A0A6G0W647_9STRA|nr:hypothetical protein Ae201684_018329 [Aphanomyces euteiches]KAH9082950.1 hypothetical protein Ae201684P_013853 [Aphanomyces euteiches]